MNQRQLAYFLEVYKHHSITAAAQSLFISPQGLSKTILALEEELDVKLFIRSGKRMLPTKEAINLTSHAKAILEEYTLIKEKKFVTQPMIKHLSVPASFDAFSYFPASFFYDFHTLYPEIMLNLWEMPDTDLLRKLDDNEVELALIPGPLNADNYELDYLFTNQLCIIMHETHPLAQKEILSCKDLQNIPLIIKGKNMPISNVQLNDFLSQGVNTNILLEVSDYQVIHEMAKENLALGMTLDYLVRKNPPGGTVIRYFKEDSFRKTMYLVHRKHAPLTNEASMFREYMLLQMPKITSSSMHA